MEQLDDFVKAIDDPECVDGEIKDEDKAIMLLNALPKSFDDLKDAILYGRDSSLTYEEVLTALKAKDFQKGSVNKPIDQASDLSMLRAQIIRALSRNGRSRRASLRKMMKRKMEMKVWIVNNVV